jgi:hypothetical protein
MTTTTTAHLKRFIRLTDIINTCVTLSQTTGPTVRNVLHSGSLKTVQKGLCKIDVCTEADLRIQKTIQENLKALFPRSRIICEEEESSIDSSIKSVITPEQVFRQIKTQNFAFTPEILALQSKLRRPKFQGYLNELLSINEEKFMSSADF